MSITTVSIAPKIINPGTKAPERFGLADWANLARYFLSADIKCSPVAANGKRASDSVRVATWLPSGPEKTCPGASDYCHAPKGSLVCYSCRLEKGRPALGRKTEARLRIWQKLTPGELTTLAAAIISETVKMQTEPGPQSAHAKKPVKRPILRIGAGGDLDTQRTAHAWVAALSWAVVRYPTFNAWLYSRSYGLPDQPDPLRPLADAKRDGLLPNTSLYLSTDPAMVERTRKALAGHYSHLPVAVLADSKEQAQEILDDLGRSVPSMVCPTERETHKWPLASKQGQETHYVGACARCRACVQPLGSRTTTPDIIFIRR